MEVLFEENYAEYINLSNADYISMVIFIFIIIAVIVKIKDPAAVCFVTFLLSALMLCFAEAIILKIAYFIYMSITGYLLLRLYYYDFYIKQ